MNDTRAQHWNRRALEELRAIVRRNAPRMSRRLEAQGLLHDPRQILCGLAARRLLPLQASVTRPLAQAPPDESPESRAFHQLPAPDRRVLWPGLAAVPLPEPEREHLASALLRLTRNAQAARRGGRRAACLRASSRLGE